MYEPDVFAQWSDARLTGDAPLMALLPGGVWDRVAPPNTPKPFLVRTPAGGAGRLYAMGVQPWHYDGVWQFTAFVDGNDAATLAAILARLDALLQRQGGTAAGGTVLLCVQEGPALPSPPEAPDGALVSAVAVAYSAQVSIP